jgi:hypothetical protein
MLSPIIPANISNDIVLGSGVDIAVTVAVAKVESSSPPMQKPQNKFSSAYFNRARQRLR